MKPLALPRFCTLGMTAFATAAAALFLTGCDVRGDRQQIPAGNSSSATLSPVNNIVTGDIQAGIEKHIAEEVKRGNGFMRLPYKDEGLLLKLVRVHVEYLATLGPRRHFACVDMVGTNGEFYDVDFFMSGDPGSMTVTETTVHKINGRPLYLWKQAPDRTWGRAPVDDASKELLGVITGKDEFDFRYQATIPNLDGPARMWMPVAQSDDFQTVEVKAIVAPSKYTILTDSRHGNKVMFLALAKEDGSRNVEIAYKVTRLEKGPYDGPKSEALRHLAPETMVPANDKIKAAAMKAVEGKQGDLMRARTLYDLVIDELRYQKFGEGWGKGDAVYACDSRHGNCTDFHAYFIGLARSVGIPARFAIGAAIPSERDDGGTDGYHCWAEFYADGKWYPVDISEADKFSALSMYYFGHHPANRFEFTRGRDLLVEPGPSSGPINFLAYPVLEVNGKLEKVKTLFTFTRIKGCK